MLSNLYSFDFHVSREEQLTWVSSEPHLPFSVVSRTALCCEKVVWDEDCNSVPIFLAFCRFMEREFVGRAPMWRAQYQVEGAVIGRGTAVCRYS